MGRRIVLVVEEHAKIHSILDGYIVEKKPLFHTCIFK